MQATMCMLRGGDSSFALLPSATGQRRRVRRRNGFSAAVTGQKRLFFPWAGASAMQPALAHRMILHTATSRELPVVDCCDRFDRGDSWVMMHLLFFSSFFFKDSCFVFTAWIPKFQLERSSGKKTTGIWKTKNITYLCEQLLWIQIGWYDRRNDSLL